VSSPSVTPLAKKLGVKEGGRLLTRAAPTGWTVEDLPPDTTLGELRPGTAAGGSRDVVVAFFGAVSELADALLQLGEAVYPDGALWIAWPRRAAGHESDIREQDVRGEALPLGLVDNKVAALGEDWSGLRLVWRVEHRAPGAGHAPAPTRG
jgi:hypothetical protein